MNRREAISAVAYLLGGTIVGSNLFITGCKNRDKKVTGADFDAVQIAFLNEVAETIIPATTSPGAKAARVGEFMAVMVKDCYDKDSQKTFMEGIDKLDAAFDKKYNKSFMEADAAERKAMLTVLDKEQKEYMKNKKTGDQSHYFRMMKELTLLGYFTSEIGATQALRYVDVPGKYEGCIPYKKGDKAFA